jgi:pyruvate dehydrogenase E2 component (dihydrolipoamide acetyltransferase)
VSAGAAPLRALTVPAWGLTMTEGTVGDWLLAEGDAFAAGDEVVELETAKISGVVEAPFASTLRRIVARAGQTLPVGALLGVCADAATGASGMAGGAATDADVDAFVAEFARTFVPPAPDAAGDASRSAELAGCRVAYRLEGGGDGLPLLLLHGFGGDMSGWLGILPALARTRRVCLVDLPGHGASAASRCQPTFARLSTLVGELADALGLTRMHLGGHSLGGGIALAAGDALGDRVAGVALLAPVGLSASIDQDYLDGFVAHDGRREMKALLGRLVADPARIERRLVDDTLRYLRMDGVREFLGALAADLAQGGVQRIVLADAARRRQHALAVLWGDEDRIVPPPVVPDVAVTRLPRIGHLPHVEAPRDIAAWLADVLARMDDTR